LGDGGSVGGAWWGHPGGWQSSLLVDIEGSLVVVGVAGCLADDNRLLIDGQVASDSFASTVDM
jgi:CubicO group peptidase (beta-lactamase class C family)